MPKIQFKYIDDGQMVSSLISNDEGAIHFVFYDHYRSLLRFNAMKAAPQLLVEDLVQELYLYLSADNWARLRRYDSSLPFERWFSVVSYRFFKDFSHRMIDSRYQIPITNLEDQTLLERGTTQMNHILMDIKQGISKLQPQRDREILTALLLRDEEPHDVANQFGVTVDNLYNIKRRAIARLIQKHLKDYANGRNR